VQAIQDVLSNPYRAKKLRLGRDYRLVYSVYSHERLVDFEFVGDRKEAYRWIRPV
jgi:mRNA-degrading endonuclease RelE of RelBE toxin-antitoxin system